MAIEAPELEALRDELIKARAKGVRSLQLNGERVEYKTDAEMAQAITDLDARIRHASRPRSATIGFSSSKGL